MTTKEWTLDQMETADAGGLWRDIGPDGQTLRYVRVKPAEWEKWQRGLVDAAGGGPVTITCVLPNGPSA